MTPVRIGYHRLWAPAMFALAVVNVVLFAMTGGLIQVALATMFAVFGVLYATRPLLVVDQDTILAKSLIGYTIKRIPHGSFTALEVERGAIVLGPTGRRQRMTLSRWMVSQRDLERLAAAVREARADDRVAT